MSDVSTVGRRKYTEISSEETFPPGELSKPQPKASSKLTTIGSTETIPGEDLHHFSAAEEAELRAGTSTDDVVRRDTGAGVHIHGRDRTQRQIKEHQQNEVGIPGGLSIAHAALEAPEALHVGGFAAELGLGIGLPVLGLGVGIYEHLEAMKNGAEQNAAVIRENLHVAVLGTLDLPVAYKTERKAKDYPDVPTGANSVAFKMSEKLAADAPGRAALQLQCDRGIHAAKDLRASGMTVEKFLEANPKVAETYAKDAAFHEGFNAYLFACAQGGAMKQEMDNGLAKRDGWHAQTHVSVRV